MADKMTCVDCGILNCQTRDKEYPEFCLTTELAPETVEKVCRLYEDDENNRVSVISAQIENEFYLQYTRVEEVLEFARRMGYHKIGIATCVGHDSLFYKYSEALITTLVAKDRVLAHNPVGALYQAKAYYKKLTK